MYSAPGPPPPTLPSSWHFSHAGENIPQFQFPIESFFPQNAVIFLGRPPPPTPPPPPSAYSHSVRPAHSTRVSMQTKLNPNERISGWLDRFTSAQSIAARVIDSKATLHIVPIHAWPLTWLRRRSEVFQKCGQCAYIYIYISDGLT